MTLEDKIEKNQGDACLPFSPDKQHILASERFVSWPELKALGPRMGLWVPRRPDAQKERWGGWIRSLCWTACSSVCPPWPSTPQCPPWWFSSCTGLLFQSEGKIGVKTRSGLFDCQECYLSQFFLFHELDFFESDFLPRKHRDKLLPTTRSQKFSHLEDCDTTIRLVGW